MSSNKHPALNPVAHPTAIHHRILTSTHNLSSRPVPPVLGSSNEKLQHAHQKINELTRKIEELRDTIQHLETINHELRETIMQRSLHTPAIPSAPPAPINEPPPLYNPQWLYNNDTMHNSGKYDFEKK